MILDRLDRQSLWQPLHGGFAQAVAFLSSLSPENAVPGRYDLVPDRLWVIVERAMGRTRQGAPLEFHRRMIDIQVALSGNEVIGWSPLQSCQSLSQPYDAERDIGFYADQPSGWFELPAGHCCVLYPHDAHAPLAGVGEVLKAVAKVAVDW